VRMSNGGRRPSGPTSPIARGQAKLAPVIELYLAALDAEEHAAEVYAELVRSADRLPRSEDPPLEPLRGPDRGLGWP
jgi:hypothetical protein